MQTIYIYIFFFFFCSLRNAALLCNGSAQNTLRGVYDWSNCEIVLPACHWDTSCKNWSSGPRTRMHPTDSCTSMKLGTWTAKVNRCHQVSLRTAEPTCKFNILKKTNTLCQRLASIFLAIQAPSGLITQTGGHLRRQWVGEGGGKDCRAKQGGFFCHSYKWFQNNTSIIVNTLR